MYYIFIDTDYDKVFKNFGWGPYMVMVGRSLYGEGQVEKV